MNATKEKVDWYEEGDNGKAKIYHSVFGKDIVCVVRSGITSILNNTKDVNFYMFNRDTLLWNPMTMIDMDTHYNFNMTPCKILSPVVKYYTDMMTSNPSECKEYKQKINKMKLFKNTEINSHIRPHLEKLFQADDFKPNSNPYEIPIKGSVINLKTGEIRKRTIDDHYTFELDVSLNNLNMETPDIDEFFDDLMLGNKEMIDYLQRLLGYSINGIKNMDFFVIVYGDGNNGKSTMFELLRLLMKEYFTVFSFNNSRSLSYEIPGGNGSSYMLENKRITLGQEMDENERFSVNQIKEIMHPDKILVRPLHSIDYYVDVPTQLFFNTYYKNILPDNENFKNRIQFIDFPATFVYSGIYDHNNPKHRLRNPYIIGKLSTKLDQLLVWLVKGSIEYHKNGLNIPQQVKDTTRAYVRDY